MLACAVVTGLEIAIGPRRESNARLRGTRGPDVVRPTGGRDRTGACRVVSCRVGGCRRLGRTCEPNRKEATGPALGRARARRRRRGPREESGAGPKDVDGSGRDAARNTGSGPPSGWVESGSVSDAGGLSASAPIPRAQPTHRVRHGSSVVWSLGCAAGDCGEHRGGEREGEHRCGVCRSRSWWRPRGSGAPPTIATDRKVLIVCSASG
jgi:hypothetical protein